MTHKILLLIFLGLSSILSLQAQYQLTPECYVDIEPNRYVIHFTLPEYWMEEDDGNDYEEGNGESEEDDECGIFSEIVMGDEIEYDVTDEAGYPELPFFSLNLLLPECVSNVIVYTESSIIEQDYPSYYIAPATKGSWVNEDGVYTELDDECFNSEYYDYGYTADYPNGFYRNFYATSNIYTLFNSKGVTFSIHPFAYYPEQGYMDVLREAIFIIEFDCGDLISTIDEVQSNTEYNALVTQLYFDTFNEMDVTNNTGNNGRYLIVAAHRDMETSLMPYVYYKQSQNYETEVIYLDDYGCEGNAEWIKQVIYCNDVLPEPDFVLLVGNLDDIPPYSGSSDDNDPYTDDPYHMFLGRWITIGEAGYYEDLISIINKTIQTETKYVETASSAVLFSGKDNKKRISKKFFKRNKKIANKSFDPLGIPYTLFDGRNSNICFTSMKQSLQATPMFYIYSRHGTHLLDSKGKTVSSGIAAPYYVLPDGYFASGITYNHISDLRNQTPYPMGFGFSCLLNTYDVNDNFGAKWLSSYEGGVSMYGSTTVSYSSPNGKSSKRMFKTFKKLTNRINNFPISLWLRLGEYDYFGLVLMEHAANKLADTIS